MHASGYTPCMANINFTDEDLVRIDAAIASGELLVAFGGGGSAGKVRYRDMKDLIYARQLIANTLDAQAGKEVPCAKICTMLPVSNL